MGKIRKQMIRKLKLTETEINVYIDRLMGSVNRKTVLDYLKNINIVRPDGNINVTINGSMSYRDLVDLAELRDIKEKEIVNELKKQGFSVDNKEDEE